MGVTLSPNQTNTMRLTIEKQEPSNLPILPVSPAPKHSQSARGRGLGRYFSTGHGSPKRPTCRRGITGGR